LPIIGKKPRNPTDNALWCRIQLPSSGSRAPRAQPKTTGEQQADDAILCGICSAVVTHRKQALRINNRHEHAFFNPAGIIFELKCFREAPGVAPHGEPTAEFTWFPGYCWRLVLCRNCDLHLGWLFTNDHSFFGLIGTRLV